MPFLVRFLGPTLWFCVIASVAIAGFTAVDGNIYGTSPQNYYQKLTQAVAQQESLVASKGANATLEEREQLALLLWENHDIERPSVMLRDIWNERSAAATASQGPDEFWVKNAQNLAGLYMDRGNWKEAHDSYQAILDYDQARLSKDDVRIGRDLNNMGVSYYLEGTATENAAARKKCYETARSYYDQAEKVLRQSKSDKTESDLLFTWQNEGCLQSELGNQFQADYLSEQVQKRMQNWHKPAS